MDRGMAVGLLLVIAVLVAVAWLGRKGWTPGRRATLLLGILGALLALGVNVALGHLNYGSASLPSMVGASSGDPGLYSDYLAVAGALTAGLLLARRPLGMLAVVLTTLLAVFRVGESVHYPSVTLGALAGALCFAVLLPLQQPLARVVARLTPGHGAPPGQTAVAPEARSNALPVRPTLVISALLITAAVLGYALRDVQDRGPIHAGERAEAVLQRHPSSRAPDEFPGMPIPEIVRGTYGVAHASVAGDVTQTTHEVDGGVHVRIEQGGAFLVAEIIPKVPLPVPRVGEEITAWGIVRHDGIHHWWELHPLLGWTPGNVLVVAKPGAGGGE